MANDPVFVGNIKPESMSIYSSFGSDSIEPQSKHLQEQIDVSSSSELK